MSSGCGEASVDLRSAGPITFGPAGILFLADNAAATVFAVDVADPGPEGGSEPFDLADVDARVGSFLGCEPGDIAIKDMAVHPLSHNVYLSVQRGHGDAAQPVLVRISRLDGGVADVPLDDVPFAAAAIGDAPAADDERLDITLPLGDEGEEVQFATMKIRLVRQPIRTATVTDMAYAGGALLVAGLSNEEFSSQAAAHPVPVHRRSHRQQPGDLPCLARQVGDRGPDPRVRALRRRREHPGQLHLHAGGALPARRPHGRRQGRRPDRRRARPGEPAA